MNHAFSVEDCIESDLDECYEWIKRCGFLTCVDENSSKQELAMLMIREMTDGVLLLELLRVLSGCEVNPKHHREYVSRPQADSQFECLTNLNLFNQLLVLHFGVSEAELMDVADIYNGRNFGRLIALLSTLSRSEMARRCNIEGFPQEDHSINTNHEFYSHLEQIAVSSGIYTKKRYNTASYHNQEQHQQLLPQPDEEKIYETLVQHKSETQVAKSKRDMCILEIVESEKNYVESLQVLVQGYKMPLYNCLSKDEVNTIFMYIEDMFKTHQTLHSKLTIAVIPNRVFPNGGSGTGAGTAATHGGGGCSKTTLHDVFIDTKPELLVYGRYCVNLQMAQNLVQDMVRTSGAKRQQLEKCQEKSGKFRKFPLSDLLTLPMQRILKYHLLFQTLMKFTETSHPDYEGLGRAHEAMLSVASFVNDVKRDQEAVISIDKIQGEMTGIHLPSNKKLSDYGRRQKDGELKVMLEGEQKPKQRHVFVFDKMVMLAKRKGDSYDFKNAFYLPDRMPESTDMLSKKQEKGYPFKISVRNERSTNEAVLMFTKSDEIRHQWIDAFKAAINNQYPLGARCNDHLFDMTTFDNNETCNFCHKLLSGIFFQGYRCKNTKLIAHKQCIPSPPEGDQAQSPRQNSITSTSTTVSMDLFRDNNGARTVTEHDGGTAELRDAFGMSPFVTSSAAPGSMVHALSAATALSSSSSMTASYCSAQPQHQLQRTTSESSPWFVGEMERDEATRWLAGTDPGSFIVRGSKNTHRIGEYSLSVMDTEPKHMRIRRDLGMYYIEQTNRFSTLKELVSFYSQNCLNNFFNLKVTQLRLLYPVNNGVSIQSPTILDSSSRKYSN